MTIFEMTLMVPDRARADILVEKGRVYYRFATVDTMDEGMCPVAPERYDAMCCELAKALESSAAAPADGILVSVAVDGMPCAPLSDDALGLVVNAIAGADDSLGFIRGFA